MLTRQFGSFLAALRYAGARASRNPSRPRGFYVIDARCSVDSFALIEQHLGRCLADHEMSMLMAIQEVVGGARSLCITLDVIDVETMGQAEPGRGNPEPRRVQ